MKHVFFAACGAFALASTMTLSAQVPAQPQTPRPQSPAPTQPMMHTGQGPITVAGCLKPWDNTMGTWPADPMAKPGDPMAKPGAAPMASTRYVLTHVTSDQPAAQSSMPAPAAGAASPAHPLASQFIVVAGSGVNLAAHMNHQVRLTGTVDAAGMNHGAMVPADKPMARPGDPAPAPGMAADRMTGDTKWATLTATSVTMINATCTTTAQ